MYGYRNEEKEIARFEFEVCDNETGELLIVFGYSMADAYRRSNLDPVRYTCLHMNPTY